MLLPPVEWEIVPALPVFGGRPPRSLADAARSGTSPSEAGLSHLRQKLVETEVRDFVLFRSAINELILWRIDKPCLQDLQHFFRCLARGTHDVPKAHFGFVVGVALRHCGRSVARRLRHTALLVRCPLSTMLFGTLGIANLGMGQERLQYVLPELALPITRALNSPYLQA